ncbi:MAG: hypothetical protein CSB44_05940 [Gammaproteobacteria bacterium]|nr:MAG: hypothetical protein CSB44_05940 [Gammaproteobacteria bacterium]PIE37035.1 MAG: hypothetical protein CSA54_02270 [Gammaproteobacteria bacterium]
MRSTTTHKLIALMLVALTLAVIWLGERYNLNRDVTANRRHSLTTASHEVLNALTAPVEIIAVVGNDPVQHKGIDALLERYRELKPDITWRYLNPETDPGAARALEAAPGGELIIRSGSREQRLSSLSERSLTDAFARLALDAEHRVAFITGHGERSPLSPGNHDWQLLAENLARLGLQLDEQSLVSEPELDPSLALVVIAAPEGRYLPGEVQSIESYLNAGGNLLWLTERATHGDDSAGLERIADNLGIDTLAGIIIDAASQNLVDSPDFVVLDRLPAHPVNRSLASPVLLPQARAFEVTPLAGQDELPLLQTPATSWTETGPLEGAVTHEAELGEVAGPLIAGLTIERELPADSEPRPTQRFAVIGDADFAANMFLGNGDNRAFAENLFLWLVGSAEAMSFRPDTAPDASLSLDTRHILILSATALAGIPLVLLAGGLVYIGWRRRSGRVHEEVADEVDPGS